MAIALVSISQLFLGELKFDRVFPLLVLLGNRKNLHFTFIMFISAAKHTTIVANVNKCTETTSGSQRHCHLTVVLCGRLW